MSILILIVKGHDNMFEKKLDTLLCYLKLLKEFDKFTNYPNVA
ncbi:hypothetical protein [Flavobacterium aestivum]|nr:hypothetical protein [Flavobacterium aestivum]